MWNAWYRVVVVQDGSDSLINGHELNVWSFSVYGGSAGHSINNIQNTYTYTYTNTHIHTPINTHTQSHTCALARTLHLQRRVTAVAINRQYHRRRKSLLRTEGNVGRIFRDFFCIPTSAEW